MVGASANEACAARSDSDGRAREICDHKDCDGDYFTRCQQHGERPLRDPEYSEAQHSDRLSGAAVLLYLLGISYRGVEGFLTAFG